MLVMKLEFRAQLPCLLHIAMCSAFCNESAIQYNHDKRMYEKIGESTEAALHILAEKIGAMLGENIAAKEDDTDLCNLANNETDHALLFGDVMAP